MSPLDLLHGLLGWFKGEPEVDCLGEGIREHFAARHCFLVSSGKVALAQILLALKRLYPDRDEVIVPAFTCYSVPSAVVRAGLKVRPCEMDPGSLGLDRRALSRLVGKRALCIVPTHLFGIPVPVAELRQDLGAGCPVIVEDAAQAMGVETEGKKLGLLGDVGFFSLGRGKAVSTVAGGIILTGRDDIARLLRQQVAELPVPSTVAQLGHLGYAAALWLFLRPSLFRVPSSLPFLGLGKTVFDPGFSMKMMSPVQAGLGRRWIQKLKEFSWRRRYHVTLWRETLLKAGMEKFLLETGKDSGLIRFPIRVADDRLRGRLLLGAEQLGLGIMPVYPGSIGRIDGIGEKGSEKSCPVADSLARELLTLPVHPLLTEGDRGRIKDFLLHCLKGC